MSSSSWQTNIVLVYLTVVVGAVWGDPINRVSAIDQSEEELSNIRLYVPVKPLNKQVSSADPQDPADSDSDSEEDGLGQLLSTNKNNGLKKMAVLNSLKGQPMAQSVYIINRADAEDDDAESQCLICELFSSFSDTYDRVASVKGRNRLGSKYYLQRGNRLPRQRGRLSGYDLLRDQVESQLGRQEERKEPESQNVCRLSKDDHEAGILCPAIVLDMRKEL